MTTMTLARPFIPHPLLMHPDLMTLVPRYWPRGRALRRVPTQPRYFTVAPGSRMLGYCHWQHQPSQHPTLLLVHGLEGCSDSHYMRGIAGKAWRKGFNVIRLNQRNCGGTEQESSTLYHNGLSGDLVAVARELSEEDGLEALWLAGYSMGGNLVLGAAANASSTTSSVKGAVAVCPNIDPAACVAALERRRNWLYHRYFLRSMQARLRRKALLFPGRFDLSHLVTIRTMREFDDVYTARDGGYAHGADYYERSGARHLIGQIDVPTLILTAEDDPFIPAHTFRIPALEQNRSVTLIITRYGGHCGFFQAPTADEDCFWGENRLIDFVVEAARVWRSKDERAKVGARSTAGDRPCDAVRAGTN